MRLVSIYFAVATLGIGEMIYVILLNWTGFTHGPMGIRGIPPIDLLGWQPGTPLFDYLVVAAVTALSLWAIVASDALLLRQRAARGARGRPVR